MSSSIPVEIIQEDGTFDMKLVISTVVGFMLGTAFIDFSKGLIETIMSPFPKEKRLKLDLFGKTIDLEPLILSIIRVVLIVIVSYITLKIAFRKSKKKQ